MASSDALIQSRKHGSTEDLRIVLMGKTGVGKSSTGNTILRKEVFKELSSSKSVTSVCQKESAEIGRRRVTVIDTPGLFDTNIPNEKIIKEIAKCIAMAAPGPHVFLLVLTVGRFTQEEKDAVKMIQDLFGEESSRYTMVLFTRGDDLRKRSIEDYIEDSDPSLQNIIKQCGNRYHVFNNRNPEDRTQVTDLLQKIDSMVKENGGSCYTNENFQKAEKALREKQERILKEQYEEKERENEKVRAEAREEAEKEFCAKLEAVRLKAAAELGAATGAATGGAAGSVLGAAALGAKVGAALGAAALGAKVGAALGAAGTAIGAGVGALIGLVVGLFY